jgi:hypothetical protein
MKITSEKLKQIIKEELDIVLKEADTWSAKYREKHRRDGTFHRSGHRVTAESAPLYYAQVIESALQGINDRNSRSIGGKLIQYAGKMSQAMTGKSGGAERRYDLMRGVQADDFPDFEPKVKALGEKLQNGKRVEELQGDIGEVAEKAKEIIETMK